MDLVFDATTSEGVILLQREFPEPQIIPKIEPPDFDVPEHPASSSIGIPVDDTASLSLRKLINDSFLFLHDKIQENHTKQMNLIRQLDKKREKDNMAVMSRLFEIDLKQGVKRSAPDELPVKMAAKRKASGTNHDSENVDELFPNPHAPFPQSSDSGGSDEDEFIYSEADKVKKEEAKKPCGYSQRHVRRLKKQIEEKRNASKIAAPAAVAATTPTIETLRHEIAPRTVLADITRHIQEIKAEVHELSVIEEVRHHFLKKEVLVVRKAVAPTSKPPKGRIKVPISLDDFESTKEKLLNDPLFRIELYQVFNRASMMRGLFVEEILAKYSAKGRCHLMPLSSCPVMTAVIDAWTQRGPDKRDEVIRKIDKELQHLRQAACQRRTRVQGSTSEIMFFSTDSTE